MLQRDIDKRKVKELGKVPEMTRKQRHFLRRRKITHGYFDPVTSQFVVVKKSNGTFVFLYGRGYSSTHWKTVVNDDEPSQRDVATIARVITVDRDKFGPLKRAERMTEDQRRWIFRNVGSSIGAYFDRNYRVFVVRVKGKGAPHYYCGYGMKKENWKKITMH